MNDSTPLQPDTYSIDEILTLDFACEYARDPYRANALLWQLLADRDLLQLRLGLRSWAGRGARSVRELTPRERHRYEPVFELLNSDRGLDASLLTSAEVAAIDSLTQDPNALYQAHLNLIDLIAQPARGRGIITPAPERSKLPLPKNGIRCLLHELPRGGSPSCWLGQSRSRRAYHIEIPDGLAVARGMIDWEPDRQDDHRWNIRVHFPDPPAGETSVELLRKLDRTEITLAVVEEDRDDLPGKTALLFSGTLRLHGDSELSTDFINVRLNHELRDPQIRLVEAQLATGQRPSCSTGFRNPFFASGLCGIPGDRHGLAGHPPVHRCQ